MSAAPPPVITGPTTRTRIGPVLREITRGGLAGLITGVLMGGVGARIAMRASSLIDTGEHTVRTENGAVIGVFTLEGTLGLIVFGGIFTGLAMAVMWVIVQRWLPKAGRARYWVAGLVGVAMGGRFAIDGRNFDFIILDPAPGQVTIYIVLAGLTGMVLVRVDGWLDKRLPSDTGPAFGMYAAISLLGLVIALPSFTFFFNADDCACVSPPRLVGAILMVVAAATAFEWYAAVRAGTGSATVHRTAHVATAALVVAGLLHLAGEIAHFV